MSFVSLDFIYLFLPILLICFYSINRYYPQLQVYFLLGTSFFFCAYTDANAALVLACSICLNYVTALAIRLLNKKRLKGLLLFTGVALNVITLLWYKFSLESSFRNIDTTNYEGNVFLDVGIPLGLSFYTFYQISFLVDTYKSKTELLGFFRYSLSASMFTQLPAGPILNYNDGLTQFGQMGNKNINAINLFKGISLFTIGLIKKEFLADHLGIAVNQLHLSVSLGKDLNALEAFVAIWGFLIQLYFDFSAYSDMAIGLGLCFGLTFPINFNSPLKAKSFSEFISSWHMSLIAFTRNYIFLPVSKRVKNMVKGKAVRRQFIGWMVGLQVSFLVINIWHAPTLMLVLQGLFLGLFFVVVKIISMNFGKIAFATSLRTGPLSKLRVGLNRIFVLSTISVFAALLRTRSFHEVNMLFKGFGRVPTGNSDADMAGLFSKLLNPLTSDRLLPLIQEPIKLFGFGSLRVPILLFLACLTLITFILPNSMQVFELSRMPEAKWYSRFVWKPNMIWGVVIGLMLALYVMLANENLTNDFMYGGL